MARTGIPAARRAYKKFKARKRSANTLKGASAANGLTKAAVKKSSRPRKDTLRDRKQQEGLFGVRRKR